MSLRSKREVWVTDAKIAVNVWRNTEKINFCDVRVSKGSSYWKLIDITTWKVTTLQICLVVIYILVLFIFCWVILITPIYRVRATSLRVQSITGIMGSFSVLQMGASNKWLKTKHWRHWTMPTTQKWTTNGFPNTKEISYYVIHSWQSFCPFTEYVLVINNINKSFVDKNWHWKVTQTQSCTHTNTLTSLISWRNVLW